MNIVLDTGGLIGIERDDQRIAALSMIDVRVTGLPEAKAAGELLAASSTRDAVDALVALVAVPGDQVLTSDPEDLRTLVGARTIPVTVVSI